MDYNVYFGELVEQLQNIKIVHLMFLNGEKN